MGYNKRKHMDVPLFAVTFSAPSTQINKIEASCARTAGVGGNFIIKGRRTHYSSSDYNIGLA